MDEDDDIQVYKDDGNALLIAYQSGYYDGKKQRPWVDLTDEDIHNTVGYNETREMYQFALALIAKLKDKNNG